jgi:hypothetical protein
MIQLSDANPIHIFHDDEETFNDTVVDNIDHECYIHEHQCDEPVIEQVYDEESGDEYDWVVYDENDVEIERIEMTQELANEITMEVPELEEFQTDGSVLNPIEWEEGEEPSVTYESVEAGSSERLESPLALEAGLYQIGFNIEFNGGNFLGSVSMLFRKAGATIATVQLVDNLDASPAISIASVLLEEDIDEIAFRVSSINVGTERIFTIKSYSILKVAYVHSVEFTAADYDLCERTLRFEVLRRSDDVRFGHSDKIYFPITCKNSVLILYKSNKNFAGLIYDEYSEHRYLRVKGRFFHPGKSGSAAFSEQSNGTVVTRNWIMKKKRKLETQDAPEYINTLIDLALAHCVDGDLTINEVSWMLADGDQFEYQGAEDRPDTYSLQPGEAWLTRKNYLKQNTL